jgi:tryptophan synthase alpha chain
MNLTADLQKRLQSKKILLMTHLVLGYPSLSVNREVIRQMAENGVDCIELQIPFSEPMADGPVIVKANQQALAQAIKVADCFDFAEQVIRDFPGVNFLFMTYYNIIFRFGEEAFIKRAARMGIKGFIVPDLPIEEGGTYLSLNRQYNTSAIMFFTPTSTDERLREVAGSGDGFIYCVARKGVTGGRTDLDVGMTGYLERCRRATDLPLAVGFGISRREDVAMLEGRADMAVIGTATIRLVDEQGPEAVGPFMSGLRT